MTRRVPRREVIRPFGAQHGQCLTDRAAGDPVLPASSSSLGRRSAGAERARCMASRNRLPTCRYSGLGCVCRPRLSQCVVSLCPGCLMLVPIVPLETRRPWSSAAIRRGRRTVPGRASLHGSIAHVHPAATSLWRNDGHLYSQLRSTGRTHALHHLRRASLACSLAIAAVGPRWLRTDQHEGGRRCRQGGDRHLGRGLRRHGRPHRRRQEGGQAERHRAAAGLGQLRRDHRHLRGEVRDQGRRSRTRTPPARTRSTP